MSGALQGEGPRSGRAGRVRHWRMLWVPVFAAILVAGGLYVHATGSQSGPEQGVEVGDYRLLGTDGRVFAHADFAGHPSMLFFGFTYCPDVCPTTLAEIVGWYDTLGEDASDLKAYFVTVDPERDTPEVLAGYLGWAERVTGLTGPASEVAKAAKAWGIHAQKVPLDSGDYTMSHTASLLLLDRRGELVDSIAYGASAEVALAKLRRLTAS
jgi:protein SCO1/2